MRKFLCVVLVLFILMSVAYADTCNSRIEIQANSQLQIKGQVFRAPRRCGNCGQSSFFILECGEFDRWGGSAACPNNVRCSKRISLYKTKYVCPECDWWTYSGTHEHMEEHSICNNERKKKMKKYLIMGVVLLMVLVPFICSKACESPSIPKLILTPNEKLGISFSQFKIPSLKS